MFAVSSQSPNHFLNACILTYTIDEERDLSADRSES